MQCRLCGGPLEYSASGVLFGTRSVKYFRCSRCRSVALPEPDWLEQAYADAVGRLDAGIVERTLKLGNISGAIIAGDGTQSGSFLDYGGGYGLLTRLLRDRGLDFKHCDPHTENVFANGFEGSVSTRYDLITLSEVLERLADPYAVLLELSRSSDRILATTELLPNPTPRPGEGPCYAEGTGQHVTLYTMAGLASLAERLGMQLTFHGYVVHLFHRGRLKRATRVLSEHPLVAYVAGAFQGEIDRASKGAN